MGKLAEIKTKPTSFSVADFIDSLSDEQKRKDNLSLHLIDMQRHADALKKLGKHKTGDGCLYINNLEDVDIKVLEKIIIAAAK